MSVRSGLATRLPRRWAGAPGPGALQVVAVASLLANVGIVLTGGAVRLTGSGLGCPAWPRCTADSYVVHGELGVHGVIEFGNRMLTFAVAAVALVTLVVVWRSTAADALTRRLAVVLAVGVPAQALLGGLTVLTDLNPWLVAGHLMLSMVMIAASVWLLHQVHRAPVAQAGSWPAPPPVRWLVLAPVRWLVLATYAVTWLVLYLGTVVTGSGPHAGDIDSPRNGLDPAMVSELHAGWVFVLIGLTFGVLVAVHLTDAPAGAVRAVHWLLGVELAQGLIGFVQYATDLPIVLVELHLLGACATTVAATALVLSSTRR